jgi:transcriptional regulator CtsR
MRISDVIASFINNMLEDEDYAIIQRNDLAEHFNCVPSQINYVISTRFTPIQGYYVESQRGGGGCIKIKKVNITHSDYLMHIITSIGNKVTAKEIEIFINNILDYGIITENEAKLLKGATNDNVLNMAKENKDEIRSKIFKNMLINLVS